MIKNKYNLCLLPFLFYLFIHHPTFAQQWALEQQSFPTPGRASDDHFGNAIAKDASGKVLVIAAQHKSEGALEAGVVYVYERINGEYRLQTTLRPSDPTEQKFFGEAVAVQDDIIAVSTINDKPYSGAGGAVYLFQKGPHGWKDATQINKLLPQDPDLRSYYGYSVAIKNDWLVVGSPLDSGLTKNSGVAYVYEKKKDWQHLQLKGKLMASQPSCLNGCRNYLGSSVAIGDDYIAVGAIYYDVNAYDDGAIFIFERPEGGWKDMFETTILHLDGSYNNAELGRAMTIHDDMLMAAARGPSRPLSSGYAYLFQRSGRGWVSQTPVATLGATEGSGYGSTFSLVLEDGFAALSSSMTGKDRGGVFIFNKSKEGWKDASEDIRISPAELNQTYFGNAVTSLGDTLYIGAPLDNHIPDISGSVYQLVRKGKQWDASHMTRWDSPGDPNAAGFLFGQASDMSENLAVVGASRDNMQGAAYVYELQHGHWEKIAKLTASDGESKDDFGYAVGLYKDYIIVGAPHKQNESGAYAGAAYVFVKPADGWHDMQETAKFTASEAINQFGYDVDINENFAAVGSYSNSSDGGGAYVFEKTAQGWVSGTETVKLHQYVGGGIFGYSLDCNENEVLVSAPWDHKAYLFHKGPEGWNLKDPVVFDMNVKDFVLAVNKLFHLSISLSKDFAVMGWPYNHDKDVGEAGAVMVYRRSGGIWNTEPTILHSPHVQPYELFGADVDIDKDLLIVGASSVASSYPDQCIPGKAYVFARNGSQWFPVEAVASNHPEKGDQFGYSVSITGKRFMVGSLNNTNETGIRAGSMFYFDHDGPWIEQVSSPQPDGWYGIGQKITIDVRYDESVVVNDTPGINLQLDTVTYEAPYQARSGTSTLSFGYMVQEGHTADELAYHDVFALQGQIQGMAGKPASRLLPHPGRRQSLNGGKNIRIDGIRPVLTDSIPFHKVTNQDTVHLYWKASEPIYFTDTALIQVTHGSLLSFSLEDSLILAAAIVPELGKVEVLLDSGAVEDHAQNAALARQTTFWYDSIAPTVKVEGRLVSAGGKDLYKITFHFSEKIKSLSSAQVDIQHGYLDSLKSTNDSVYVLTVSTPVPEHLVVDLWAETVLDMAGNTLVKDDVLPVSGLYFHEIYNTAELTASMDSLGHVALQWTDLNSNETGFQIMRFTDPGRADTTFFYTHRNDTTWTDTLIDRTVNRYYYQVVAFNYNSQSSPSNTAMVDFSKAVPQQVQVAYLEGGSVLITWLDYATEEDRFFLERSSDADFSDVQTFVLPSNTTEWTDSLPEAKHYFYRLKTHDYWGESSEPSRVVSADFEVKAPVKLSVTDVQNSTITFQWEDVSDNESGFMLERSRNDKFIPSDQRLVGKNVTTWVDSLPGDTTQWYYYRLRSFNRYDTSQVVSTQKVPFYLPAPVLISMELEGDAIKVQWKDKASNEHGFYLEKSHTADFKKYETIKVKENMELFQDQLTIPLRNAQEDTTIDDPYIFFYRIKAFNRYQESAYAESLKINLQVTAPEAFTADILSDGRIALRWIDQADNEKGYIIEHATNASYQESNTMLLPANASGYTDEPAQTGLTHYYRVAAYNPIDTSTFREVSLMVTGIADEVHTGAEHIRLYPNPVEEEVHVYVKGRYRGEIIYEVIGEAGDIKFRGKAFKSKAYLDVSLSLETLPAGLYWLYMEQQANLVIMKILKK